MATWPSTLPAPRLSGYVVSPTDQTIRTDMEAGNSKVRRRTAARVDTLDVSWSFTETQFDTFRDWFEDSSTGISSGATWFTVTLATGTGSKASISARFSGAFVATLNAFNMWTVNAKLETRT